MSRSPLGLVKDPHDELVAQQWEPAWYRPVWHVGHLVYKGGIPSLKRSSMTGGGFIPAGRQILMGLPTRGEESPSWQPYATPVNSMTGSGFAPNRPNFLTRLFGGAVGSNQ
jgi:hypothetical protein